MALAATSASAPAQPVVDVPGSWKMSGGNIPALGLLYEKTDLHFFFLFGLCKQVERVRVFDFTLDADPRLYADTLTGGGLITMHFGSGTPSESISVLGLDQDIGHYGWALRLRAVEETFRRWRDAPEVVLSLAVNVGDKGEVRQRYRLPKENRREAIGSFIQACFQKQ